MPNIKMRLSMNLGVDYIIFNGKNGKKVLEFVVGHKMNGDAPEDCYTERPKDIPNLGYNELLEWWKSTGEIVESKRNLSSGATCNTHNSSNLPYWEKDELAKICIRTEESGYCRYVHLKIGTTFIAFGKHFEVTSMDVNTRKGEVVKKVYEYLEDELGE